MIFALVMLALMVLAAMFITAHVGLVLTLAGLLLAARLAPPLIRLARAPAATRRHMPMSVRMSLRWRYLARNLGLAAADQSAGSAIKGESVLGHGLAGRLMVRAHGTRAEYGPAPSRMHYPPARFRADEHGVIVRLRTIPGVGRAELDDASEHMANYWQCARVQVVQTGPGRVTVRGLRRDPLSEPLTVLHAPPGTFMPLPPASSRPAIAVAPRRLALVPARLRLVPDRRASLEAPPVTAAAPNWPRLYLGRDSFGQHRHLPLRGVTGITVAGLPGMGKSSLINSWLCQLAWYAWAQFVTLDGKGSGDYEPWADRCWLQAGDDLAAAVDVLEQVYALMRDRLRLVLAMTGMKNAWNATGPTADLPLILTVIDECQQFFDLAAYKGDKELEPLARRAVWLTAQLIRKGRSVMMLTIPATQKPTGDSLPTSIRDNSALGVSFGLKTIDASVAALGDDVREYPSYSPVSLRELDKIGVCAATMPTGADPYSLIRCPHVTEEYAEQRALETAGLRHDPSISGEGHGLAAVS